MDDFSDRGTGYLIEEENHEYLQAVSQPANTYSSGDFDPSQLGDAIGMIDVLHVEDQQQLSSCAGNSSTTILEECLFFQGGIKGIQLSRMFAYINGQHKCGINGDRGATLEGVIKGFKDDGCPEEKFMPYTGEYYTDIPSEARNDASNRKLEGSSQITDIAQIYEGLAKRIGGTFIGIPCTQEIFNSGADGILENYFPARAGGHAMAFVDWCPDVRDSRGWPYLLLANSWGIRYGYRGYRKVSPRAANAMLQCQLSTMYLLSDMKFIKPRYDWKSQKWAA